MADRTLTRYTEPESLENTFPSTLRIERSAAGQPGIFVIVINALEEESSVFVPNGDEVLAPVNAWLNQNGHPYGSDLQGGTELPDDGRRVANAGEFAAAWNNRTSQQREDLVVQLLHQQDTTIKCFQEDHDGLLEQLRARQAKANEWLVLYLHDDCVECEGHAESAIAYAQISGSVGSSHQETDVIPYDRAGDPTFQPAMAHGAKVRRAG